MKKPILTIYICMAAAGFIVSCSGPKPEPVDFVKLCYDENPGRSGLPLSQVQLLYEGVTKAEDASARQTLHENCPDAASRHLK